MNTYRKIGGGKISDKDISVVVQGPIVPELTRKCLSSVRKTLPEAQVILSTWEGSRVEGLDYDEIVLSKDPRAERVRKDDDTSVNNINRQLVSTNAGCSKAKRPYLMKLRSDLLIKSDRFLEEFQKHTVTGRHFQTKVLILDYYTRHPYIIPVPFHPSDWFMFGRREDVVNYYDEPLMPEAEMLYFSTHSNRASFFRGVLHRFTPEQWICIKFLEKSGENPKCETYYDCSPTALKMTIQMFREDFIVIDSAASGICFTKYNPNHAMEHFTLISHIDWLHLCQNIGLAKIRCMPRKILFCCRCCASGFLSLIGAKKVLRDFLKEKIGDK